MIEVLHGVDVTGPTTCDACGGQMRKLLSAPAIVFKGSGWAKKDARSSSKPAATEGDGKTAAGSTEPKGSNEPKPGAGADPAVPKAASGTD